MFRTHLYQMGRLCQPISGTRNYTFISIHVLNSPHSPIPSRMRHILSSYHWHLRMVKCLFVISSYFPQGKKWNIPSVVQIANVNCFFFFFLCNRTTNIGNILYVCLRVYSYMSSARVLIKILLSQLPVIFNTKHICLWAICVHLQ